MPLILLLNDRGRDGGHLQIVINIIRVNSWITGFNFRRRGINKETR